jgi:hypothetical protein
MVNGMIGTRVGEHDLNGRTALHATQGLKVSQVTVDTSCWRFGLL